MPQPSVRVLEVVCLHHRNFWGIGAASQAVGRGGKGHRYEVLFASSSLVVLAHPLHTQMHLGGKGKGRVAFPPPAERNWGRGRGEWQKQNSEEKLYLGKAVALIQNDPFKEPM